MYCVPPEQTGIISEPDRVVKVPGVDWPVTIPPATVAVLQTESVPSMPGCKVATPPTSRKTPKPSADGVPLAIEFKKSPAAQTIVLMTGDEALLAMQLKCPNLLIETPDPLPKNVGTHWVVTAGEAKDVVGVKTAPITPGTVIGETGV